MTGALLIILACLFWSMDSLIRYPLVSKGILPVHIVFFEHFFLVLIFSKTLFSQVKRVGDLQLKSLFSFMIVGGLGSAIATVSFTKSFYYLNPSLVILLQKLQPLFAIFLARFVLGEPIQKRFIFLSFVCLLGGLLVSYPDLRLLIDLWLANDIQMMKAPIGYILVAVSIIGWGASTVYGKKLSLQGFQTSSIMAGRFLVGFLALLPFVSFDQNLLFGDVKDYLRIFVMVMISGALAMGLYYQGLKKTSARNTAILEMFFPLFAIIVNWLFLGKELTVIQLIGGVILLLGSFIVQLKKY